MNYPRSLAKNSEPFNPIEISQETEKRVIDGNKRKYNLFRLEPFYGQIATARGVGCNLRCSFCWISPSRDYPEYYGSFFSPQEVYDELIKVSSNKYGRAIMSSRARISGCEPTIGADHLLSLIDICKNGKDFRGYLLETNGILLGENKDFVRALSRFGDFLSVRLSFKAGTPEDFEKKTGAKAGYFDLPFRALEYLKEYEIPYTLASMSKDPKLMPPKERRSLLKHIINYGIENIDLLDEEKADPFGITGTRLIRRELIGEPVEIRRQIYEPLINSVKRAAGIQIHDEINFEGIIKLGLNEDELKNLFETIEFQVYESPCVTCNRNNPWHGHNINDDLDARLKRFR